MPKAYEPVGVEEKWYRLWEERGYFRSREGGGEGYCIMIPPPNVTGSLHMGHAFQDTLMDALTRYHRMSGRPTLWQPGTDHAGIATQMVVERQLESEGLTRHDLGRENFVSRVWKWRQSSGGTIVRQLRRMGASCDWSRERFTMDEGLSRAVVEVFVRLYREGLIYRGKRLVNWDPVLHTAVSDLEVISEEEEGRLWHLRYPLAEGDGYLVVATTRPETMLGDTAVAVHPEDERFRHLIGKMVHLPLTEREIPIIADEHVDPAFGSGCVKITPAHDFNDYEVGQRHGLEPINIFNPDACLNHQVPLRFRGLDRYVARERVVAELEEEGLLDKIEPHRLMVPRGDRSKAVVEPLLTDQWYVKTGPLAEEAIRAVEDGRIRFVPANWAKTYFEWMRNIQDWCISRQIWWGHRIPAWYGPDGEIFVAATEEEAKEEAQRHYGEFARLTQDDDVLDTWFSSALWPFSTLGWPEKTAELATFYPTSVLVTGFDIIFFWVARMIMMGLKFTGEVPFREVYIHGLVRDGDGNKMSKSKGNILDPLDLIDGIDLESLVAKRTRDLMQTHLKEKIEKATRKEFPHGIPAFGTDALRFTFAALATQGRDIKFDMGRIDGYRHFCNKLWNAARFVLMQNGVTEVPAGLPERPDGLVNRWILSRLERVKEELARSFAEYRFSDAAQCLYQFVWGEYCDWYVELAKPALYDGGASVGERVETLRTLVGVLERILRLLHPLMPFITEELWQRVAPVAGVAGESVMLAAWPEVEPARVDARLEEEMAWMMAAVGSLRNARCEMGIPPGKTLRVLHDLDGERQAIFTRYRQRMAGLGKVSEWESWSGEAPAGSATAVVTGGRFYLPLAGVIDLEAESARLQKNLDKLEADLQRVTQKLANEGFLAKANPELVAKEREREQELRRQRQDLVEAEARLRGMRG
ncbi:MAG: valine--tRNA ligase [Magnetococcales bacterium]|nr:valine--tRNA ligase [Magnetococcales bacterium]